MDSPLLIKSKQFALDIIKVCNKVKSEKRESLNFHFVEEKDFFEQIMDEVEKTLIISYKTRKNFAHYVFENDSVTDSNYRWWIEEIKKILNYAIDKGYIKKSTLIRRVMPYGVLFEVLILMPLAESLLLRNH